MISRLNQSSVKEAIFNALVECRLKTQNLFQGMDESTFCSQPHGDFSPVGWHLGHIGYTESLWLLEHSAGLPCGFPQYRKLYAADGLPKSKRVQLPSLEQTLNHLNTIRQQVLQRLEIVDIEQEELLWRFLVQHESQHCEIISLVLELIKWKQGNTQGTGANIGSVSLPSNISEMILIPSGEFEQGNDHISALDNERPAHKVYLDAYYIDRYPVTCGQYRLFMEAGGYDNPQWWSEAGWQWRQTHRVIKPLYWSGHPQRDNHPVYGVSCYEAEAYSRFVGKRLPTEAEWEKAASWDAQAHSHRIYAWGDELPTSQRCNCGGLIGDTTPVDAYPAGQSAYGLYDTLGNVWEWTATYFHGYSGFQSYPYMGYSQVYFDRKHRVLKGGSWATLPWGLRTSFRNWYYPRVNQIFAGFRCAASQE
ncbi:ergothioneine biosynthesis protein EgtB [Umezakia ovalisporum]|uniref:Ergothioneine biosynthesis protein EgtB n=1 Tax=Umezakia ovalisporum FSS-43 TaxID=2740520 RepID=A0ABT6K7A8_9CYAN|nr:ergothioneine biosynthesis protein EgtB [Umezakia ovalisporum]MDH6058289.1 ergothioneine biosynthesis protein EgtB [Umezakia ovalisporum FSS-43]MDH6071378.1 ergothioneine biosynthesis protein EgtB [Umezakia ovalisporum CobakiLakeA]MDH6072857.1 ergothioneine biosynthesis protein EgtB [Umezakia ovalisporum CS-1034]MDH6083141.1 ergothioneine biosynthesis protein EgtB [Umezakia ovalisporum FSS-44]MDH6095062.1 ergothioneine biosynthesis protein EgtB [Umezakia ovalisporum CobakiLakeB]